MKSLVGMAAAVAVALGLGGVDAQAHASHHTEMVHSWYQRYLHRQPDPGGLHAWVSALRCGGDPTDVQASILSSEEYFCAHGHTATGYVTGLYTDVLGRAPCAQELNDWTCRLRQVGCRKRLALDFFAATAAPLAPRPVVVAPHGGHRHLHAHPAAPVAAPVVVLPPQYGRPTPGNGVRFSATYSRR